MVFSRSLYSKNLEHLEHLEQPGRGNNLKPPSEEEWKLETIRKALRLMAWFRQLERDVERLDGLQPDDVVIAGKQAMGEGE